MRVVVTGGLGFVGSHLCAALASDGHDVVAVDDLSGAAAAPGLDPAFELVVGDAAAAPLAGADAVVHLAAAPGVRSRLGTAELRARNVEPAARLARAAAERGIRFVLASTSSVYGDAPALPTPESARARPLNPYARSKLAAERACPQAVVVRMFTVYGPRQRPDMAFARWIEALAQGRPLDWCAAEGAARDFTFVGDAARGLIAALEHGRPGQAYNLGGGGPVRVRAALGELERLMGASARLAPFAAGVREARVTWACGRKSLRELGYRPEVGLREGLERQLAAAPVLTLPAVAA